MKSPSKLQRGTQLDITLPYSSSINEKDGFISFNKVVK